MQTPRVNRVLFALYTLASLLIFITSLFSPMVRGFAPAPLRDLILNLILPPPEPVELIILYSTEKQEWLEEAIQEYEKTNPVINYRPVEITTTKMGSREMYLAVLDGKQKPVIMSPAGALQVKLLQDLSGGKYIPYGDANACKSVFSSPLVLVAWRERADALWGDQPPANLWGGLQAALINPRGWEAYGHPEWGYIKFGQTNPLKSNSGFMTILLMTYGYFGKTSGLTSADILTSREYQQWFLDFQNTISKFGDSTGTYMKDIVAYGPSVYDIVAVYEATAIEQAENAIGRYGELWVYYPPATVTSDHPFCILDGDWISPEQRQAAQQFIEFLLSKPMQELALLKYGFRPVEPSIALDQPGSPFLRYANNGYRTALPPLVEIPTGDVLNTLLNFWDRNIQR